MNVPVVMLTTSETATSGVLAVLPYTTMTGRDVTTVLASVGEPRRHFLHRPESISVSSLPISSVRPKTNPPANCTKLPTEPHRAGSARAAESSRMDEEPQNNMNLP